MSDFLLAIGLHACLFDLVRSPGGEIPALTGASFDLADTFAFSSRAHFDHELFELTHHLLLSANH